MKTTSFLLLVTLLTPAYLILPCRGAAPVIAENAIETPTAPGVQMHHMVAIRLSGRPNSGIKHVINGRGASVITTQKSIVD